jgi:hypothetical protein
MGSGQSEAENGWINPPLTARGFGMTKSAMRRACAVAGVLGIAAGGCTQTDRITGLGIGGTLVLAQAPTQELEQTTYVGIFDPQDQIPPMVYRIRLRGQSSFMSFTKIQAGWAPAGVVDSLSTSFSLFAAGTDGKPGASPSLTMSKATDVAAEQSIRSASQQLNRRLVMFGPEGFREAPSNHRFVVVAGSSPESFFAAVDQVLGDVASARDGAGTRVLRSDLLDILSGLSADRRVAETLKRGLDVDLSQGK